jgi:transposase InsO family protein
VHERWARLRFSVIGALLAAPPAKGALRAALQQLAAREWRHPSTGAPVRFGVSTLERWYYRSRNEQHDPVSVLRRKRRQDAGEQVSMTPALRQALMAQYSAHKSWSAQLHHDNLVALAETRPELRSVPSYATVRRFLAAHGLTRRRPMTTRQTEGALAAAARLEAREVRSYEAEYVNGTWHWDCHHGSRKVLTQRGEWRTPILFGVLDDRSRLACHLQWYLSESAENIAHGLSQAMQKRGLPRAAMSDNGAAMTATEITEGLARLGIIHQTTLPYSPYQNGKQEVLWGSVEGRLMAMLEGVDDLSMARLNEATQVWVEQDYNRKRHSEIDDTPLARFLAGPAVTRPPAPRPPPPAFAGTSFAGTSFAGAGLPGCRSAAAGLHPHRAAHPAQERWHRRHRRSPLRSPQPLSTSFRAGSPLRRLGSHPGPARRSAHRHGALPAVPAGQGC